MSAASGSAVPYLDSVASNHEQGRRRAQEFIAGLTDDTTPYDELWRIADVITASPSLEAKAHTRGFFFELQAALRQVPK